MADDDPRQTTVDEALLLAHSGDVDDSIARRAMLVTAHVAARGVINAGVLADLLARFAAREIQRVGDGERGDW